jgi:hypothetical protein
MNYSKADKVNIIKHITASDEFSVAPVMPYRLQSALRFSKRGWRVLPVTKTKVPLISGWPKFATTNADQLRKWWNKLPKANVGIATGEKSGFWVVDIDVKHGLSGWDSLFETFGEIEFGEHDICVQSPSGGLHLYFQWDQELPVTVAANVLPGVDIRGETGFIMAPPSSIQIDGKEHFYRFNDENNSIPEAPEWAKELARMTLHPTTPGGGRKTASGPASGFDVNEVMEGVTEGNRDNALFRYACHLRGCRVPYSLAEGFLLEASVRCNPPFHAVAAIEKLKRVYATLPERKTVYSLNEGGAQ